MTEITQSELKQNLNYNPDTGIFTRIKANARCVKIGDIAGCLNNASGYIDIGLNRKYYKAHRLAWLYVYGQMPPEQIDHINHDRADNRIVNLRCVTHQENNQNATKRKDNTSGFTGVVWHKRDKKWYAKIMINGKRKHLGYFADLEDAISARQSANIKYGYHGNHGKSEQLI